MADHPDLPEPMPPADAAPAADGVLAAGTLLAGDRPGATHGGHGHHGPFHTHCENCGAKLEGPWCHRCGQHDFEFHRSFRHVFWEALESFFHFEGKFFRNIVVLLFQPGRLTAEFNAGKRAAQMPPFRLYVFVSLVFFFLLLAGNRPDASPVRFGPGSGVGVTRDGEAVLGRTMTDNPAPPASESADPAPAPSVPEALRDTLKELEREQDPQRAVERLRAAAERMEAAERQRLVGGPSSADDGLGRLLEAQAKRALTPEGQRQMVTLFFAALPKMLLLCLPLFALLTRVIFRKSGQVYLQHLVLALHFHTFIYLFVLFRDGWAFLAGLAGSVPKRVVLLAATLWLLAYPFLMVRRLFGTSWPGTILRTFVLGGTYGLALVAVFFGTAIILFLML